MSEAIVLADGTTGEVMSEDEFLEALASRIRVEYRRSRDAIGELYEAQFAIGQCLLEAKQAIPSKPGFGAWLREQQFGFTTQWANVLRSAAEYEDGVRFAIESQLSNGKVVNLEKAVKQAKALAIGAGRPALGVVPAGTDTALPEVVPDVFPAIVIDPPWRYDNKATRGAAEDHYGTMSMDELVKLDVPAADNAHLYLWVTNGFIREGFGLLDAYGFAYKTCLTWVKPQIGMGNYFRNNTEHVLFGIKGSLPTNRNNCPTAFTADRTKHSAKPESFYDLVESSSPGPYLSMFARSRRFNWFGWGHEA